MSKKIKVKYKKIKDFIQIIYLKMRIVGSLIALCMMIAFMNIINA